jgi:hypothetical protein
MRARAPGERTRERARHCIAKSARGEGGGTRGKCPYPGAAARQDSRLNYVEQHSERLGLDAGRLETLRVRRPARPQHYGFYLSCTEWLCTSGSVSPVATQWPRGQPQRAPGAGPCWGHGKSMRIAWKASATCSWRRRPTSVCSAPAAGGLQGQARSVHAAVLCRQRLLSRLCHPPQAVG